MQYRARLSSIVRHAAAVLPEQALQAAQQRLDAALTACSPGSGQWDGRMVLVRDLLILWF